MKMNRFVRLVLFAATIYPGLYVIWANYKIYEISFMLKSGDLEFERLFILQAFTLVVTLALLIFYLVHLYRNPKVQGNNKMTWTITLFLGSFVVMPFYWWRHIWLEDERFPKQK